MNYEVDKKSFYNMMEKVFNNLYGENYCVYKNSFNEDYKHIVGEGICKIEVETNELIDYNNRSILLNQKMVESIQKCGNMFLNNKKYKNETFKINEEKNEIFETICPYIMEYPFLSFLPRVIEELSNYKNEQIIIFTKDDTDIISEVFSDYKDITENERAKGLSKIRKENY